MQIIKLHLKGTHELIYFNIKYLECWMYCENEKATKINYAGRIYYVIEACAEINEKILNVFEKG